jgi:3-phenylpropionate/trans-cinnamate dioxygenase ferredoxin reductase subunit
MSDTVVIAGAGQAAAQAIVTLRHGGFAGDIVLTGEEAYLPYQRPPLSKKFLAGELELERLFLRHAHFYAENRVEVRLGTRVEAINRATRTVRLGGEDVRYDRLILATGSHVRRLSVPGEDLAGVHYLRTVDDVRGIRARFGPGGRLVVIGAGYIGLEVAAVAVTAGLKVTVVEIADRVMGRVVSPPLSRFYERVHRTAGVRFRLQTGITEIRESADGLQVVCTQGEDLSADLVVIGVGILPTTALAEDAGLSCDNGIIVDEFCRTGDPCIYAAGDCTNHPNTLLGRRLRLESVHNAQEQGKAAALSILGKPEAYAQVPWFWSDQFDLKLQITGLADGYTTMVIRGDTDGRSFAAFYFADKRLIAVHAVNSPREFMLSKKLIAQGAHLDADAVADSSVPFKDLAEAARNEWEPL